MAVHRLYGMVVSFLTAIHNTSPVMCFPVGFGVNPKRDLSLFNNLADLGAFFQMGFALVALGLIGVGLSCLVPGEIDE
jgi:hypothetical protein